MPYILRKNVPPSVRTNEPAPEPPRSKYAPNTHPWNMQDSAMLRKLWGDNSVSAIAKSMRRCMRTIKREAERLGLG